MNISIINGIGNSMKYWANYICAVKREKILNESSIKFCISEYLVASENMEHNRNFTSNDQPIVKQVEFEKCYNIFKKRRADLYLELSEDSQNKAIFFEFKYLRDYNLTKMEFNRFVDDFLRLASLLKNMRCECYFMLVGNSERIKNMLVADNKSTRRNIDKIPEDKHNGINECLSLKYGNPQKVKLKELKCDNDKLHLERFVDEYTYNDNIKKLENNDELSITLKYPQTNTIENISDIGVYIWQIELDTNHNFV